MFAKVQRYIAPLSFRVGPYSVMWWAYDPGSSYRPVDVRRKPNGKWFAIWFGDRIRIGRGA
jgi:photosystem II stability/assembly factor-like uncharacterized protein